MNRFVFKFLSVKILHPSQEYNNISGLSIDKNHERRLFLNQLSESLRTKSIIYSTKNDALQRTVEFRSLIKVANKLSFRIDIDIKYPKFSQKYSLLKDEEKYIHFDFLGYDTEILIEGERVDLRNFQLDEFFLKPSGFFIFLQKKERDKNMILKLIRPKTNQQSIDLYFLPVMSFENFLPMPLKLELAEGDRKFEYILNLKERISVTEIDITKRVEISFKIGENFSSAFFLLIEDLKEKHPNDFMMKDQLDNEFFFALVNKEH